MKRQEGKDIEIEEPQKNKRVNDEETVEFIKTLKGSAYYVVDQLKKLLAKSLYCHCYYRRKGIERHDLKF